MTGLPWDDEYEPAENNAWRGDKHMEDWPEYLAAPEYRFWKKEEGGDDDLPESQK